MKMRLQSVWRGTGALALCLGLAQGAWGCASAGDPLERATQIAGRALQKSTTKASTPGSIPGAVRFVARYNPCRCQAPPFEIWSYGRWQRTELRAAEDETVEALHTYARSVEDTAEFTLLGWPSEGAPYPGFELEGFEAGVRASARGSSTSTP
ncbi:hypothetical protein DL240_13290 [Lujinxingia litoralis]|uniref:Uncharacterized protein n=1 Tax=Lujinxingia litoralis TaxID=2211119 RepID=A0A328CA13_9DELT|nr:hypothetical protein [Lujinxingia litoralis]RAL21820.1 hypothetical protein DL240_13290 [Lujinxingia litoralis]